MKEKKNEKRKLQVAPPGFEPAPQLPPAQIVVRPRTTEPATTTKIKFQV